MDILSPGTHIGQYEIASKPMIGGMGVVYFCIDHTNDGRPVALKTFKPEYLPDRAARDRFLREGSAWVQLGRHPHIVRCYKVEYIDPTAFLVLELIAKEQGMDDASLRSWMGAPMPVEQALLFALQIARGMKHATKKIPGFVHRDLKPENVLVGADKLLGTNINRLRVTDFGLATILKDEVGKLKEEDELKAIGRTHLTHGIVGTPLYMAPEQWKGEEVGVYTDVYALGCILYEMLTGQRAAGGHTIGELQAAHSGGKLRPIPGDLSSGVQAFLRCSLSIASSERYQGWDEMVEVLQALGADIPDLALIEESLAERQDAALSYNQIGLSYFDVGKAQVAIGYFEKALKIGREVGDQNVEGYALGNLGLAYADLEETRRAIEYYQEAIAFRRKIGDRRGEGNALRNLGMVYADLGEIRRAIGYYEQGLEIAREIGDQRVEGLSLSNLGVAYKNLGDAQRAIRYIQASLTLFRTIGNRRFEGNALGSLGATFYSLDDLRNAIKYFEEALKIGREIGDLRIEMTSLRNLGVAYQDLDDIQRAIGYYEECLILSREIGDLNSIAMYLFNIARLYSQQGEIIRAIPFAHEAVQIWSQIGSPNVQQAQQLLTQLQDGNMDTDPLPTAFDAFMSAGNVQEMQTAVEHHPLMNEDRFIQTLREVLDQHVSPDDKPYFEQRLVWLRQIAGK